MQINLGLEQNYQPERGTAVQISFESKPIAHLHLRTIHAKRLALWV
jgi:hypothetical protein